MASQSERRPHRRIVGIDPGSVRLGVGCVERHGSALRLLYAETILAPPRAPLFERLEVIAARLKFVIDELAPEEIAIEDIFHAKNARSAFHLGMARGVALATCLGRGIQIFEYAPTQVKAIVTGYGRADKDQVSKMVRLILGADLKNLGHDATDAIALAICHANTVKLTGALSKATLGQRD